MAKRRAEIGKKALQQAILALRNTSGQSTQDMATAAGVSTRTLRDVMEGAYTVIPSADAKKLRGYAESLTRLSLFCDLQPDDVLREYGLDLSLGDVKAGRDRILMRRTPRWAVSDPVLQRIYERPPEVKVYAGILHWAPFAKANEVANESWAWAEYVRRLLGTVNPLWPSRPHFIDTIGQAIRALHSRGRDESDLMFGVYDTAYRRTLGLGFIPLPGIGVPLGLVYANPRPHAAAVAAEASKVAWQELLSGSRAFRALALKEEAGHLFLKGVCEFADGTGNSQQSEVYNIDEGHSKSLPFHFVRSIVDANDSRPRIFVADLPTCNWLYTNIKEGLEQALTENSVHDTQLRAEYQAAARSVVTPLKDSSAPVYPVSIAVRADAVRWEELLKTATKELFQNSPHIVARAYATVLGHGGADVLCPLPLEPTIPKYHLRQFWEGLFRKRQSISDWLAEAQKVWEIPEDWGWVPPPVRPQEAEERRKV